ncbi:hypothetical protein P7H46_11710 [Enterococcus pseudoavium]|uniref:Polymerase n=1 Tax=Enterococcus pseudoavium TaxID=44007 RepID=A0ABU3FK80_9ENTE|nr:hypothetical protein [Enterococcus pseudoavium]MDT2771484.1 hypothetical protein [Enterococcus pseudoavium]
MKSTVTVRNFIIIVTIFLLILSAVLSTKIAPLGYVDELLSLLFLIYLLILVSTKFGNLSTYEKTLLVGIACLIFIGFFSTIFLEFKNIRFAQVMDALISIKPLILFTFYYVFSKENTFINVSFFLRVPLCLILLISTFLGFINQFIDIGMTSDDTLRFGLKSYEFIMGYSGNYGIFLIAVIFLILGNRNSKMSWVLTILGCISIIQTTRIQALIFVPMFIFFYLYYKKFRKMNLISSVIVGLLLLVLGNYQLNVYLLTTDYSPRRIFIENALKIANNSFPLGSGYATFGSEMASRYYSPLYTALGFEGYAKMGRYDGEYLNDTFIAMVLGQFGWIGFLIYYGIFGLILKMTSKINNSIIHKSLAVSSILTLMIASIGSGIVNTGGGLVLFSVLGLLLSEYKNGTMNKRAC